ncbi:MAG: 4-hydroxy-3-methylbut-2-enyl diphosphate reductase [Bacteroidia bacterium]
MKTFNIPSFYRSPIISKIKEFRKLNDPRKKDNNPSVLSYDKVQYYIARHFGFCYGVENAIEIAFKALQENEGKNVYLLSQMIHNPIVNQDLLERGVKFLQDTYGNQLIPFDVLTSNDVVVIPAFGAPVEILDIIEKKGIDTKSYNTTCPFVERVWRKSEQIGADNYTIVIHGKYNHEETKSTFSRSSMHGPAIIIKDLEEAKVLATFIKGEKKQSEFEKEFVGKYSGNFNVSEDFKKIGVINQTTMLATETAEIANYLKEVMIEVYGENEIKNHFADTRDTLCYATNENQDATYGLLKTNADLAIVVGGYNSSNTSHLVELCEEKFPTYFISSANEIDGNSVNHFNIHSKGMETTNEFLPPKQSLKIVLTSGASCPDSLLDEVIAKINLILNVEKSNEEALNNLVILSSN